MTSTRSQAVDQGNDMSNMDTLLQEYVENLIYADGEFLHNPRCRICYDGIEPGEWVLGSTGMVQRPDSICECTWEATMDQVMKDLEIGDLVLVDGKITAPIG